MKKKFIIAICAVAACAAAANAQEFAPKKWYLAAGLNLGFVSDESFGGGAFEIGYHLKPNHLLALEFSGNFGDSYEAGTYHYGPVTNPNQYTDGKINRALSMNTSLFSYYYVGNFSPQWEYRIGASLGVRTIASTNSFSVTYKDGAKIPVENLQVPGGDEESSFSAGINLSVNYNINDRWFVGAKYRLLFGSDVTVNHKIVQILDHFIVLGVDVPGTTGMLSIVGGWRF